MPQRLMDLSTQLIVLVVKVVKDNIAGCFLDRFYATYILQLGDMAVSSS